MLIYLFEMKLLEALKFTNISVLMYYEHRITGVHNVHYFLSTIRGKACLSSSIKYIFSTFYHCTVHSLPGVQIFNFI